jgi:hypothetical protein
MGTLYAIHGAAAVKQIDLITVSDTWTAADTVTLTMNTKDLVITIGADTATTQVAAAIRDAWNATSRLDSEGTTDATSNFGGQEFGEYSEATAFIDPDSLSVVRIIANKAGVPFTLTVTEATAGSGVATESTSQAATGPWHWNNIDNWSTGAVPVDDDIVVFKDQSGPNVGFKYGLPNSTDLEVTIQHWMSYTGQLGLPPINAENPSKPYPEYRQRYIRLDDGGTGTDIAHRFGLGQDGTGSPLINLKHITVKCSPIVFNTGTPQVQGLKALNICCTATTSTLNIINGSVDWSSQDSGTTAFLVVKQIGGDSRGVGGLHTTNAQAHLTNGTMLISGSGAITQISVFGGQLRVENQPTTTTITTVNIYGGTTQYVSAATITQLSLLGASSGNGVGGTFDASVNAGNFTVTDCDVYAGNKLLDPYRRITFTNPISVFYGPSNDLVLGATASTAALVTFA